MWPKSYRWKFLAVKSSWKNSYDDALDIKSVIWCDDIDWLIFLLFAEAPEDGDEMKEQIEGGGVNKNASMGVKNETFVEQSQEMMELMDQVKIEKKIFFWGLHKNLFFLRWGG